MSDESRTSVLVSFFEALRSEIGSRSEAQANTIQLAITALGVIAGLAFAKDSGEKRLLLLVPLLTSCLGLVWADHSANIRYVGRFIRDKVSTELSTMHPGLPDWEKYIQEMHQDTLVKLRTFIPPILIFAIVPGLALIVACLSVKTLDKLFCIIAGADIVLLVLSLIYFIPLVVGLGD